MMRHKDHGPGVICRPAFGYGLCEPLPVIDAETALDAARDAATAARAAAATLDGELAAAVTAYNQALTRP